MYYKEWRDSLNDKSVVMSKGKIQYIRTNAAVLNTKTLTLRYG